MLWTPSRCESEHGSARVLLDISLSHFSLYTPLRTRHEQRITFGYPLLGLRTPDSFSFFWHFALFDISHLWSLLPFWILILPVWISCYLIVGMDICLLVWAITMNDTTGLMGDMEIWLLNYLVLSAGSDKHEMTWLYNYILCLCKWLNWLWYLYLHLYAPQWYNHTWFVCILVKHWAVTSSFCFLPFFFCSACSVLFLSTFELLNYCYFCTVFKTTLSLFESSRIKHPR